MNYQTFHKQNMKTGNTIKQLDNECNDTLLDKQYNHCIKVDSTKNKTKDVILRDYNSSKNSTNVKIITNNNKIKYYQIDGCIIKESNIKRIDGLLKLCDDNKMVGFEFNASVTNHVFEQIKSTIRYFKDEFNLNLNCIYIVYRKNNLEKIGVKKNLKAPIIKIKHNSHISINDIFKNIKK